MADVINHQTKFNDFAEFLWRMPNGNLWGPNESKNGSRRNDVRKARLVVMNRPR